MLGREICIGSAVTADSAGPVRGRWIAPGLRFALFVGAALLLSGCAELQFDWWPSWLRLPSSTEGEGALSSGKPGVLSFGAFRVGRLHCAEGQCENGYDLAMAEPGQVRIEVYAPYGREKPDFGLRIEDASGKSVARSTKPYVRPRRIDKYLERGTYRVLVYSLGSNRSELRYEVTARVAGEAPPARVPTGPTPPPATAPPGPEEGSAVAVSPVDAKRRLTSEVLDVEEDGGVPTFVLIEAGETEGIRPGMKGQLLERGARIAEIEVVEVFPEGSRARIQGEPGAPVDAMHVVAEITLSP